MTADSPRSSSRNYEIVDPIGEIRGWAKELYAQAGKPEGKTWEDFFSQAEQEMLEGKSKGESTRSSRKPTGGIFAPHEAEPISTELKIIADSGTPIESLVATAVRHFVDLHESICLANILQSHTFSFVSGHTVDALSTKDTAGILALVAGEYDTEFAAKLKDKSDADQRSAKVEYWTKMLQGIVAKDEPLTFADQNTIRRLISAMKLDTRLREMVYK